MQKTKYACGFLLDFNNRVVLIRKNRPKWQAGRLNGVGGHVEEGETPLACMVREFEEETGARVESWTLFAVLSGADWEVSFFYAYGDCLECESLTDEQIVIATRDITDGCIDNIPWLLSMIESRTKDRVSFYRVEYVNQ